MTIGGFGLIVVPVVLLHQAYLRAGLPSGGRPGRWWHAWRNNPTLTASTIALALALALAVPWHVFMYASHGLDSFGAMLAPFDGRARIRRGVLSRLVELAPATVPLGLFSAGRMIRMALTDETDDHRVVGGVFWVLWLAVGALAPALWPNGPRPVFGLFLLVPLNLLTARAISDLANRRLSVRTLIYLAPATAASVAWWASANLRGAIDDLTHARAHSATALGLHLGLDLLVLTVLLTRWLDRWARRRDDRQRRVLGGFLLTVLVITIAAGMQEMRFRHRETDDLLMLRTMVVRRNRRQPFDSLVVVSPEPVRQAGDGPIPGGRLRFILRSALPHLPQRDLTTTDELLNLPEGQRLVILAGTGQRLSYAVQSRLGLEAIHPGRSGVLDAFATAAVISDKRTR
jgi:hypothetical protein